MGKSTVQQKYCIFRVQCVQLTGVFSTKMPPEHTETAKVSLLSLESFKSAGQKCEDFLHLKFL